VSVCLCVCVAMCRCVGVSVCRCVGVSVCLCVCASACLCVCVSVCPCVCVSACTPPEHHTVFSPVVGALRSLLAPKPTFDRKDTSFCVTSFVALIDVLVHMCIYAPNQRHGLYAHI